MNDELENELLKADLSSFKTQTTVLRVSEEELMSLMGTYCAAYFNLGVSFEYLGRFKLAGLAY